MLVQMEFEGIEVEDCVSASDNEDCVGEDRKFIIDLGLH